MPHVCAVHFAYFAFVLFVFLYHYNYVVEKITDCNGLAGMKDISFIERTIARNTHTKRSSVAVWLRDGSTREMSYRK